MSNKAIQEEKNETIKKLIQKKAEKGNKKNKEQMEQIEKKKKARWCI